MRIAFAIPGDLEALTGGYAYDRQLIIHLRAVGHDVEVIGLPGGFPNPTEADLTKTAGALAAVPRDTVLLVDGLAYGALTLGVLDAIRAPIVSLVHHPLAFETGIDPARAEELKALETDALTKTAGVVVTSPHTGKILVADFGVAPEHITVALPGLDPAWRAIERSPREPPLIVAVGTVIPRKGYDVLLAALGQLMDLEWRAVIVGSLERAPETATQIQADAAQLFGRVSFPGEAPEQVIRDLFGEATAFALTTRYEGFGMVFLEAMAAGLPIVATRGGPLADVIPADAGLLSDVDDVGGVAASLRKILTKPSCAAALSEGARRAGAAANSWDETAAAVVERLTVVVARS